MIKRLILISLLGLSGNLFASNDSYQPKKMSWPFDGVFGKFDKQSVQRGFQVYKEVCATCHSINQISFRNLEDIGFSKEEISTLAATYEVQDGPNDQGEMFMRSAKSFDKIPSPYTNEKAARAANNGAYPPDLSLIIKARANGANYVYSLLTGYGSKEPANFKLQPGMVYNPYFPGMQISMPAPLSDGQVSYIDGTNSSIEQMSMDVVNFLQWAAEPEMEKRKLLGFKVMIYIAIFCAIFYIYNKRVWADIKKKWILEIRYFFKIAQVFSFL